MLVDHADALFQFLYGLPVGTHIEFFFALRIFGRMAFPIFAWFAAEGCRKTRNFPRYLLRLGIFAAISQIPFGLAFGWIGGNVIVTFFIAALVIFGIQSKVGETYAKLLTPILLLAGMALAGYLHTDYDWLGVLLVVLMYLCGERKGLKLSFLAAGMVFLYLFRQPLEALLPYWNGDGSFLQMLPSLLPSYLSVYLPFHLLTTLFSLLSVGLLALYNGKRGGGGKWFFYWFYPVHLFILYVLREIA